MVVLRNGKSDILEWELQNQWRAFGEKAGRKDFYWNNGEIHPMVAKRKRLLIVFILLLCAYRLNGLPPSFSTAGLIDWIEY